jgi:uncharacterized protein
LTLADGTAKAARDMAPASAPPPGTPAATASSRLTMVDGLRGYALFGLFLVHMVEMYELYWADPVPSRVHDLVFAFFFGKSFSLLAICFGFSFFIMMEGARRRGQSFAGRFAWRLIVLLVLGWFHAALYRGDIIVVLGLAGFVLIPFDWVRSQRVLLATALVLLAQPFLLVRIVASLQGAAWALAEPLYYQDHSMEPSLHGGFWDVILANIEAGNTYKWSYYIETGRLLQVFGLFLLGLALGRGGFFADPARYARARAIVLALALIAIPFLLYGRIDTDGEPRGLWLWTHLLISGWADLAVMIASALIFILLWENGLAPLLSRLVPAGRMTLTLYVGQSLVFVPFFYGFGLHMYDQLSQQACLAIGLGAFALQLAFATWWFRRFQYGPLEWAWRAATKLSLDVPFRRRAAA